jgi:DNA-binding response OmpR family regulator
VPLTSGGTLSIAGVNKPRILVVDDEPELRQMLHRYLEAEGFEVAEATDGETALSRIRDAPPDLIVLDVGLPGADGFAVLQETRRLSDVPVIMLTARTEEVDRVVGLTIGADDYIAKPFSPRELVARIRAVLRRGARSPVETDEIIEFEGVTLDLAGRRVGVDGRDVELSALEFDLFAALASAPGRVFTRAQLLERVWGWDYFGPERVVDVHIGNIRKVLGDDASDPRFIGTVRGVGYRFVATPR